MRRCVCTAPWPAVRSAQRRPRARDGLSADAQQLRVREQIPGGRGGAVGGRPRVCRHPLLPARGRPSCPRTLSLSAPRFLWLWHSRRGPHAAGTVLALLNAASSVSRTAGRPPPRGTVSRTRSLCSRAATLTAPHTCVRGPRSGPFMLGRVREHLPPFLLQLCVPGGSSRRPQVTSQGASHPRGQRSVLGEAQKPPHSFYV